MEYTWSTIEFIGEENFLTVCRECELGTNEIEILRKIISVWDLLMIIPDPKERIRKKMEVSIEAIKDLPLEKRERLLSAQLKISLFLVGLRQKGNKI